MTDDDDLEDREPELSLDDALELGRRGERVERPRNVGPTIGGRGIVREAPSAAPTVRTVWWCSTCQHLVALWHACDGDLHPIPGDVWDGVGGAYANYIDALAHKTRNDKWLEWGPDTWRAIPEYPNYELNGYTREVRRREYTKTLKNGQTRHYPEREVKAHKSSVTLTNESGARAWGIEKLWKATFPEYSLDPNSWNVHTFRKDNIPAELGRVIDMRRSR